MKDVARKKPPTVKKEVKVAMVAIDYERLKSVSGVVRLKDVLLNHSYWHSMTRATGLDVEPTAMAFNFALADATWDFVPHIKRLVVQLGYRLAAFARVGTDNVDDGEILLFQLECDWHVVFEVPDEFSPVDVDALADFTVANGQLNAFPYERQYVQDVTSRAGWPPLVLPTFRVPAKRPKAIGKRRVPNVDEHE